MFAPEAAYQPIRAPSPGIFCQGFLPLDESSSRDYGASSTPQRDPVDGTLIGCHLPGSGGPEAHMGRGATP